ncbi:Unknown protein [Striga hermonthica]|uniref:Uncharacterized protein n=1 Tax=Striga hermonthica TaxID=68872 RepID=A0A9N7R6A5_STRHE|nr:Unknown protein [Striga hermonthica]
MSWANLKKLFPPKKFWKLFKTNLPLKLQNRLNRSKATKKNTNTLSSYKATKKKKLGLLPSLSIQPKKFKKNPKRHHSLVGPRTKPPPVFVDQLFIEPVCIVKRRDHVPIVEKQEFSSKETPSSTSNTDKGEVVELSLVEEHHHCVISADDMWESVGVDSAQMHGINEKADEFISRFRAEMRRQEMLARRL